MHRVVTTGARTAQRGTAEAVTRLRAGKGPVLGRLEATFAGVVDPPAGAPEALSDALKGTARQLAKREAEWLLRECPPTPALQKGLEGLERGSERFTAALGAVLTEIARLAPAGQENGHAGGGREECAVVTLAVPLIDFAGRPAALVTRIVEVCLGFAGDGETGVGSALGRAVRDRLLRASGLTEQAARDNPHRLKWPGADDAGAALVDRYLGTTPLARLLLTPVPVPLTDSARFEHMLVTAGSGHGKTQTLQHFIVGDLARPAGQDVGLVVMDSQGDLIDRVARLERLQRSGRLVLVDPTDPAYPPGLNLFDLGGRATHPGGVLGGREQEQLLNATRELYKFVFGGVLGAEFTAKQTGIFLPVIELMLSIPGATILTLLECMRDPMRFMGAIERLPRLTRTFLTDRLQDKEFRQTRQQIEWRLNAVLMNGAFQRSFSAKTNTVDLFQALNAGKVVLINTAKEHLGEDGCRIFGRYMLALTLKAAMDRARLPEASRRPAFVYVDEAADYFDDSVARLLSQARKYNVGCVLAHQALEQMSDSLRELVFASTSIKLAGGVSARDARALAAEMRTTPEFVLTQDKDVRGTRFAAFVRALTPTAVSLAVPFGTMEREPALAPETAERALERLRAAIASAPADDDDSEDHHDGSAADDAGDDFSSRY